MVRDGEEKDGVRWWMWLKEGGKRSQQSNICRKLFDFLSIRYNESLFLVMTGVMPPVSPPVLQKAWPVPSHCHSITDCSMTAYCTASITGAYPQFFSDLQLPLTQVYWPCHKPVLQKTESPFTHSKCVSPPPQALRWSPCGCHRLQSWVAEQRMRLCWRPVYVDRTSSTPFQGHFAP